VVRPSVFVPQFGQIRLLQLFVPADRLGVKFLLTFDFGLGLVDQVCKQSFHHGLHFRLFFFVDAFIVTSCVCLHHIENAHFRKNFIDFVCVVHCHCLAQFVKLSLFLSQPILPCFEGGNRFFATVVDRLFKVKQILGDALISLGGSDH